MEDPKIEAENLLEGLIANPMFMRAGRRNDDAVNLCICTHVLGYGDADKWFLDFIDENHGRFTPDEIYKALDHIKRVMPYLEAWGPNDNEGEALAYAL